jgi:LAGLIDADG endonuclease
MGFERNYQIKIPSKQLNKISYSTLDNKPKILTPWFISGLIDGEGSFSISIYKSNEHKLHWGVRTVFVIDLHEREYFLLLKLQEYFGGIGTIFRNKVRNTVNYSVAGIPELKNIIIPHFENYPLLTQKLSDFLLFKQVVELIIIKKKNI